MSLLGFLAGGDQKYIYNGDPRLDMYQNDLASTGYDFGPSRKYYKGILGDAKKGRFDQMPGMGMFDQQIGAGMKSLEHNQDKYASLGAGGGYLGDRVNNLNQERLREGVNSQRYGFAQNQLDSAAQGLSSMFANKNQFNLNKYNTLINSQAGRSQLSAPKPGFLNSLTQGAAAVGSAYLGPHN